MGRDHHHLQNPRSLGIAGALVLFQVLTLLLLPDHPALAAQTKPLELLFARADADHNGAISEEEWHQAMQERFIKLDADNDGSLSPSEVAEARHLAQDRLRQWRNQAK